MALIAKFVVSIFKGDRGNTVLFVQFIRIPIAED